MGGKKAAAVCVVLGLVMLGILYLGGPSRIPKSSEGRGAPESHQPILLKGSGATFPEAQIQAWIKEYTSKNSNVYVEYVGGGSGKGQNDIINGVVDFAASDPPLTTETWRTAAQKYGKIYQFPIIVGGVAVVYNLPEIPPDYHLKLTPEVLVKILLGEVEYWDDSVVRELNPEVAGRLPHKQIVLVHRSDSSGTTCVFTTYLSLVSDEWKERVGAGKLVEWPLDALGRGVGAPGNQGVAETVKNTPYSIGYVELAYTGGLGVAALQNRNGKFVLPTTDSIAKGVANVTLRLPEPDANWEGELEIVLNPPGDESYPIIAFSHFIVKGKDSYDAFKARTLADFIEWIVTEGQKPERIVEGYVPLPPEAASIGLKVAQELRG